MSVLILTPNTTIGSGLLNTVNFIGNTSRKIFTVGCDSAGATFSLFLNQGGSGSAFSLFPATGATISMVLSAGTSAAPYKATFSIDYDSSLGTGTTASLTSSIDILTPDGQVWIGPTTSLYFTSTTESSGTFRELGPQMIINSDGNYEILQSESKITKEESSFGLLRTNPLFTGNVKISVDSDDNIWLNSIESTKELTNDKYKKYALSPLSSYAVDINNFFDNGKMPPQIVYALFQADQTYTSTKRSFDQQYDRFYQYGVSYLNSKYYSESYSFFAPLYLQNQVPEYFVIFRVDGPVNEFSYTTDPNQWNNAIIDEILSNAKIIKTYDLKNNPIGKYLENIIQHPARKQSDLTVSFYDKGYTTFNGISYMKGTYAQMGELLHDYYSQENPLINVEEFLTQGFQRNGVISTHILNLEFLFDDDTADTYSINRYFGFYVNAVDLAKFEMNQAGLQQYSASVGQTPVPRRGVDGNPISKKIFTQTNSSGIRIYGNALTAERIPALDYEKIFSSVTTSFVQLSPDVSTWGLYGFKVTYSGDLTTRISVGDTINFNTDTGLTASGTVYSILYENNITTVNLSDYTGTIDWSGYLSFDWKSSFYTESKASDFNARIFSNEFVDSVPRFFYVKDNLGDLHSVLTTRFLDVKTDDFNYTRVVEINLKDTQLDISKFGGFDDILTQTNATILDSIGKSSIEITLNRNFVSNDYLEVRWNAGPTNMGHPTRWKVIANTTGLNPGESWPTYTTHTDANGEYYLAYFHPGDDTIHLNVLAKSIKSAFDRFSFKDFEVLAKDDKIIIKSSQAGKYSNQELIEFSNHYEGTISIMGITAGATGSVNFIGGSDRKRTRAKIPAEIAQGMLVDEYIVSKGSYVLAKSYNILGETIKFSPYVDEPLYDNEGRLIDFVDSESYYTLMVDDETHEIDVTSEKKLTTYRLFKPSYGILSLMPLKDFDTDFYSSDYGKIYTPELVEYFSRHSNSTTITGVTGSVYYFGATQSFDSYPAYVPFLTLSTNGVYPPSLSNTEAQFLFYEAGSTATIVYVTGATLPAVNDTILFMPGKKHMYFSENLLAKFKGFLGLSDIVNESSENEFKALENMWDPTRFELHLLGSEYDRMAENFLKTLVLKSRVVPYVTKWVSELGNDVRDNPYRFNYHRVFGTMNFSPSINQRVADPKFHTHEWPYLDSVPSGFDLSAYPDYAFSYFFDKISDTYDFSSVQKDWFSEYFTIGYPTEKYTAGGTAQMINIAPKERYSYFNFENFSGNTFTLFRGHKIQIQELDTTGSVVVGSTKYDKYRFSVIIETSNDDILAYEDPISFTTTVNEAWKFIVVVIKIKTRSYRFPSGAIKYVDLYTLEGKRNVANFVYGPTYSVFGMNGFDATIPSDVRLTVPLNFASYSSNPLLVSSVNYYDGFDSDSSFIDDFSEQIVPLKSGDYSDIVSFLSSGGYETVTNLGPCSDIPFPNTIHIQNTNSNILFSAATSVLAVPLPYTIFSWSDQVFYHQSGGDSNYLGIAERLSFFEISQVLMGTSIKSTMNYKIYDADGNLSTTANYSLNFIEPDLLTRTTDYIPFPDTEVPSGFFTESQIGAVLGSTDDIQSIYRYNGNYVQKFVDVMNFWLREDNDFTAVASQDFLLSNTRLAIEFSNFGVLKNQFYQKVSDKEILTIAPGSGYQPVYPLVNEIAIDKKDVNLWTTSWDKDFYRKYTSTKDYTNWDGVYEMQEVKSFLGTKVMKLYDQYSLFQFELTIPPSNVKTLNSLIDKELSYTEINNVATLQVNVYQRLMRELMGTVSDPKARKAFLDVMNIPEIENVFNTQGIENVVKSYLIKNILPLYEITDVQLYVLQTGNSGTGISTVTNTSRPLIEYTTDASKKITLSQQALLSKGYVAKKDASVKYLQNLVFQISNKLDSRYYTSLSIGVTVKRI